MVVLGWGALRVLGVEIIHPWSLRPIGAPLLRQSQRSRPAQVCAYDAQAAAACVALLTDGSFGTEEG